ncbi:response regulator transcription factor [Amycolatopsis lurida]|uniref:response regulator transcription factor n=1 Tax=Amycolatopsis lurida TaxID=31959 RepID=UPI0030CA4BEE
MEDDTRLASALRVALARHDILVHWVTKGREALAHLGLSDVILLDLGLPDMNGFDLCRSIRKGYDTPIVIVSARGETSYRVAGLRSGADDYLVKPFNVEELIARMEAILRRRHHTQLRAPPEQFRIDDVLIDFSRREVVVGEVAVALTGKEFRLLELIVTAQGAVCQRERLISGIWGKTWPGAGRALNVQVGALRAKVGRPDMIVTVHGVGYRLADKLAPTARTSHRT